MDRKKRVEEEVEKTLSLMDNMENLEPNPYLYTRIKAGLNESNPEEGRAGIKRFSVFKLLPALLVLLAIMNFYSIIDFISKTQNQNIDESRAVYLRELSSEFMLTPDSYYSLTTE